MRLPLMIFTMTWLMNHAATEVLADHLTKKSRQTTASVSLLTPPPSPSNRSSVAAGTATATASDSAGLQSGTTLLFPDQQLMLAHAKLRYMDRTTVRQKHVCCPTKLSLYSPTSGVLLDGSSADVYKSGELTQTFLQGRCVRQGRRQRRQVQRLLRGRFQCLQHYTYSYAVFSVNSSQVLNYMRLPSHCSCVMHHRRKRRVRHRKQFTNETSTASDPL